MTIITLEVGSESDILGFNETKEGIMDSNNSTDPLQSLIAEDTKSIDKNRLAAFLQPYVRFDKTSKGFSFLADFDTVATNDAKIEVVLIASKARALIFDEPEGLSPTEIISLDILPEGSVKSSLKKLYDTRKIKKNNAGKYILPNYRLNKVLEGKG